MNLFHLQLKHFATLRDRTKNKHLARIFGGLALGWRGSARHWERYESAYLLQAELFSQWRFTAPTPPLPKFFEQLYVNLVPAMSSKYPPGT